MLGYNKSWNIKHSNHAQHLGTAQKQHNRKEELQFKTIHKYIIDHPISPNIIVTTFEHSNAGDNSNQEGTQVNAGKINYHIVTIKPEKDDFHDNCTILGR